MIRLFRTLAGVMLALLLAACASSPVAPPAAGAVEQLLAVSGASLHKVADVQWQNPYQSFLTLSPAMEQFVQAAAPPSGSASQRLDGLFEALRYTHPIEHYDHATLTAADAFRLQRANCLSFSAMFIAMARAAGLDARFQEVDVPPAWASGDAQTLIQYRHVNVLVRLGRGGDVVIDLRPDRYSESFPRRVLSDSEALTHYYSNLSMDYLLAGELMAAQALAHRALVADDGQSFVWNNMGIIQRRKGELALAETSYRQALALNPHDWSAMSNLAYIFGQQGKESEALRLRGLSEQTKLRNPYYRYALARQAYARGDFHRAVLQLDEAIQSRRSEARFFYWRAMSQWQLGNTELAVAGIQQAIELAADTSSLLSYERQLAEWQTNTDSGLAR